MHVLFVQKMAGIAGSETYHLNILPALVQRGISAAFLIIERPTDRHLNDEFARRLETAGVHVIRLPLRTEISWRLIRDISSVVRAGAYDIVQSNLLHADVWLAVTKRFFVPAMTLISTKHGYSPDYQSRHGLDPKFVRLDTVALATRIAGKEADRVVTISCGLRHLLATSGLIHSKKIEVIPYGFTFEAKSSIAPGAARFGQQQIVTVARLIPVKQHELLIRAFAGLLPMRPELKLVIVGGGPEETRLKSVAQSQGVSDAIVWTGFVSNPHDYLRDSDVFVLTSAAEGFGAVILEAWHNRLPVICFDVPAQNEIVTDGVDGILVPPYDCVELQRGMEELLSDGELRVNMGAAGRRKYESDYSIDAMTSTTIALYERVIRNRKLGGSACI